MSSSSFPTKGDRYEAFLQDIRENSQTDRGLNFHLAGGATISRKTVEEWIPGDPRNGGYGVLVHYALEKGTGRVKVKELPSRRRTSFQVRTEDAIAEEVERSVSKVVGREGGELSHTKSFMDLGLDSLSLNELAADLTTKTGGAMEISPTMLFKRPSIVSLSSFALLAGAA